MLSYFLLLSSCWKVFQRLENWGKKLFQDLVFLESELFSDILKALGTQV